MEFTYAKSAFKPFIRSLDDDSFKPNEKKSYEIKFVFIRLNENIEHTYVNNLFNNGENILKYSNVDNLVVYSQQNDCFYVKTTQTSQIYRCDYNDIALIHYGLYGKTYAHSPIEQITIKKGGGQIKFGNQMLDGTNVKIELFTTFIKEKFDVASTIFKLER